MPTQNAQAKQRNHRTTNNNYTVRTLGSTTQLYATEKQSVHILQQRK
jgi:hypothetical protein